jgi:predicted metal-binding membrane protein
VSAIAPALEQAPRRIPIGVLLAIAVAWAVAVAAELSGTAGVLHRHAPIEGGAPLWGALLLFLVAWQAMVAAMMLPSSLPLIRLFDAVSGRQERAGRARVAFLGGYAAVWTAFGAVAFLGDVAVYRGVDALPGLTGRPWLLAGSVLALAGAFQFSDLKEQCLSKCRHPGPYLFARYRRGAAAGFRLGFGHGLFCLGCCWALMLVMFAVGVAVFWWMAALTALMLYEKVGRHGTFAARAAGVALLGAGILQLAHPAWLPSALAGSKRFASSVSVGPGAAERFAHASGYELRLQLGPSRALKSGAMSLTLRKNNRPVSGARIRATFSMLDMDMGNVSARLPETGHGTYGRKRPKLGMAGRWGLSIAIAPPGAKPFTVNVLDQVAP